MFPILWRGQRLLQSIVFTVFSNAEGVGLSKYNTLQIQEKKYIEWENKTTIEKIERYYILYYKHTRTQTYVSTHTHRKQKWTGKMFFAAVFPVQPARNLHFTTFHHWFPQIGGWTALKAPPSVLKSHPKPAFHPWVSPKRSLDSPKTTSKPKKKNLKKMK